ncbi:MAG TPA: dienelactone hydrolase family protein [Anaerolineaceae bacterium]|nr:dienelactone hydrolase family protein [Anaerolineaceae bacterium]
MEMKGMIEHSVDDGTGWFYVAAPQGKRGPGVLVLHAWWGLTDFFKSVCDRLAEAGFVAVAPDLYSGKVATTIAEAEQMVDELDYVPAKAKVTAGVEVLLEHPSVRGKQFGVIGFSMGAGWALQLSRLDPAEIKAVVLFYGTQALDFARAHAAYQGHFAEADPYESDKDVRILEQAIQGVGCEVTFYTYPGTGHWFFEADRPDAYNPQAAQLAWERTVEFLNRQLAP